MQLRDNVGFFHNVEARNLANGDEKKGDTGPCPENSTSLHCHQIALPSIPSGRLKLLAPANTIFGDENVPSALTDLRDIGLYTAKIISDPRTLNRRVFAFTEMRTQNQLFDLVERLSAEKPVSTNVRPSCPCECLGCSLLWIV